MSKGTQKAKKKAEEEYYPLDVMFNGIGTAFVWAMAIAFPLLIGTKKYGAITKFKGDTFYTFICAALILTVLAYILNVITRPSRTAGALTTGQRFSAFLDTLTLADSAVFIYWLGMMLSTLLSDDVATSFIGRLSRNDGAVIQTFYVATYFVISRMVKLKPYKVLTLTLGGALTSLVAIVHYFGVDILSTGFAIPRWQLALAAQKTYRVQNGINFLGSMGNINLLSYFLVISLVVTVGMYVIGSFPKRDKYGVTLLGACAVISFAERCANTDAGIVALIMAAVVAVPVLCTDIARVSRMCGALSACLGAWWLNMYIVDVCLQKKEFSSIMLILLLGALLLGAAAVLARVFSSKLSLTRRQLRLGSLIAIGLCGAGIIIAALVAAKTQTKGTLYELGQILSGNISEKFGSSRILIWKRALGLFTGRLQQGGFFSDFRLFIFGSGPDSFLAAFEAFWADNDELFSGRNLDKAHNEYLQLLVCQGILGLGCFLTFLGGLIRDCAKKAKYQPLAIVFVAAIVAYAFHAFFGYALPVNTPAIWTMLGLAGCAVNSGFALEHQPASAKQKSTKGSK